LSKNASSDLIHHGQIEAVAVPKQVAINILNALNGIPLISSQEKEINTANLLSFLRDKFFTKSKK